MSENKKIVIAIFPYLKTTKPFSVAGFTLRSSKDTNKVSKEVKNHLKKIIPLFYLGDNKPIEEAVYTIIDLSEIKQEANEQIQQLRSAHIILSYLLTSDDFDTYEQTMLYLLSPERVYKQSSKKPPLVPGYNVTVNWLYYFEIAPGEKIYPPRSHPPEFQRENLSSIPAQLRTKRPLYFGLEGFIEGKILDHPKQRRRYETLLQVMSWHSKSFSRFISEEERVVHLAIAYEILYHQEGSNQTIKEEIKTQLRGIFGETERLNSWVNQFYDERSRILHEGSAKKLNYVAGEKRPTEKQLALGSLVSYGRRLLQMCILNILHGTVLSEEANLNAWFTHDKERLEEACMLLNDKDTSAKQRLESVISLMYDLGEHWFDYRHQKDINLNVVHATGKLFIETYLEVFPETNKEVKSKLEKIINADLSNPVQLVETYSQVSNQLKSGLATYRGQFWPRDPKGALVYLTGYAGSPHMKAKAYSS